MLSGLECASIILYSVRVSSMGALWEVDHSDAWSYCVSLSLTKSLLFSKDGSYFPLKSELSRQLIYSVAIQYGPHLQ